VEQALQSSQPLVRETAVLASRHLLSPDTYQTMLAAQANDNTCPTVRHYAQTLLNEENHGIINH
jgi:hypothetical protein